MTPSPVLLNPQPTRSQPHPIDLRPYLLAVVCVVIAAAVGLLLYYLFTRLVVRRRPAPSAPCSRPTPSRRRRGWPRRSTPDAWPCSATTPGPR
ncbi:hypothetical protein GXW82_24170 [Streptacidiphilus sp. 4-A2]|nr:hypothetical protein [Streptacidiphilus sp. 4-A2]